MHNLSDYDYDLPEERIAQHPAANREHSRLLALKRQTGNISHHRFRDITSLLHPGDVLVVNDTRVIPARLAGRKATGGKAEVLLVGYPEGRETTSGNRHGFECRCLIRTSRRPAAGTEIVFPGSLTARVTESHGEGLYTLFFESDIPFEAALEAIGSMPLPPYIRRESGNGESPDDAPPDSEAYQTVYAARSGAVAAPTAGLHFTEDLLGSIREKGVSILTLTLHVGYGTFRPVRENDIRKHRIHSETYHVSPAVAEALNAAKSKGRRVVAVGTTSVRTLEYLAGKDGTIRHGSGSCDLFIYPGYQFKAVDAMITNFHLPRSTLLMLVSAFAGRNAILRAYEAAIQEKYRFYSYGDAMFIG